MTASQKDKVKLTIDGVEVEVPKGTSILNAALQAGIEIPHFCYHPSIGVDGNCRMCLVEIEGAPKLVLSCATEAAEGTKVLTNSEKVIEARRGVLEFLLLNHPLDCPICDKGGECPLQDAVFAHRKGYGRYDFPKKKGLKHHPLGETIIYDEERCILCSRCVRFLKDVTGTGELFIENRGGAARVTLKPGGTLNNKFSGNLGDLCPVGALTDRKFRFKARPWEMSTVKSVCAACSWQCSIQHWIKDGNYMRTTPLMDKDVNASWLCNDGRYFHEKHISSKRLLRPVDLRSPAGSSIISFDKAYTAFSHMVADNKKVFFAPSSSMTNEELALLYSAARDSDAVGIIVPRGFKAAAMRYSRLREAGLLPVSMEDMSKADVVVLIGEDPGEDHPVLELLIRKRISDPKDSMKLYIYTSEPTSLDKEADMVLRAEKGSPSEVLDKIPSDSSAYIMLGHRMDSDKIFEVVIDWALSRNQKTKVMPGLKGPNEAGWFEVEKAVPGVSVEFEGDVPGMVYAIDDSWISGIENTRLIVERLFEEDARKADATLVFPAETHLEKNGTMTNTFGLIRRLRQGVSVLGIGYGGLYHLQRLLSSCGAAADDRDAESVYKEVLGSNPEIPHSYSEIRDYAVPYHHYRR